MTRDKNIILIFGDDEYLARQAVYETLQAWVPPAQRALALETIEGALDTTHEVRDALERCREALLTPAFFGMRKTVWLRDVNFLEKHPALNDAAVKKILKSLAEAAAGPDASGTSARLLISAPGVDKRTGFYIACRKKGEVREFSVPARASQASAYAHEQLDRLLERAKIRAPRPVRNVIIERAGDDTGQLANEVEKLRVYLGENGVITAEAVRELVPASRQFIAWEFTDAIGSRDLTVALRVLRKLFFQKEPPLRLLAMLDGFLRDLTLYRYAVYRRWVRRTDRQGKTIAWNELPPRDEQVLGECMERDPRVANPYRMGILARTAAAIPMSQLMRWRFLVAETYRRMFKGNLPPECHLEILLLRMLAGEKR